MNAIPFETLNGWQCATAGSNTVSVPLVMTTATGAPCVCQPKFPPGCTVTASTTIAPGFTFNVIGVLIVPAPSAFAKIDGAAPNDAAARTSAAAAEVMTSVTFM